MGHSFRMMNQDETMMSEQTLQHYYYWRFGVVVASFIT